MADFNNVNNNMIGQPWLSWRSIIAGLVVALFSYLIVLSLGLGLGGVTLAESDNVTAKGTGIATGVWMLLSVAIGLFAGSYFASRVSRFPSERVGASQSTVIAAIFFATLIFQLGSSLGTAGRTLGSMLGTTAASITEVASSSQVQDVFDSVVGDLTFRSPPDVVLQGLALRIFRGDMTSARDYLTYQAKLPADQVQRRIDQMRDQLGTAFTQSGQVAARAVAAAGWSLFILMVIGSSAAIAGGVLGARQNARRPLAREHFSSVGGMSAQPI